MVGKDETVWLVGMSTTCYISILLCSNGLNVDISDEIRVCHKLRWFWLLYVGQLKISWDIWVIRNIRNRHVLWCDFLATYIKYILIQAIPVCYFKVSVEIIREKAKKLVQTTHDGAERNFLSPCFFFLRNLPWKHMKNQIQAIDSPDMIQNVY
jgi:hypothetical protein